MKKCVFCGVAGVKMTAEHIFARWIQEEMGSPGRAEFETAKQDGVRQNWMGKPFSLTVKEVCGTCNNGWMSDLEGRSQKFLKKMLRGEKLRLVAGSQQLLATWAAKTALVICRMNPENAILPLREYAFIYEHRKPSTSTIVWLSRHTPYVDGDRVAVSMTRNRSILQSIVSEDSADIRELVKNGQAGVVMFSIGELVVTVLSHDFPCEMSIGVNARFGARFEDNFQQIWPPIRHHFHWPRVSLNTIGGFDEVFRIWQ